jgi:hypothetical protein
MRLPAAAVVLVGLLASNPAFSGDYVEPGVKIVQIKTTVDGYCYIRYRYGAGTGASTGGGTWTCTSYSTNMLNTAQVAYLTGGSVDLTLDGSYSVDYKPLKAIQLNEAK